MSIVDIILGIILVFAFYTGLKQGLFVTLASLIGLVAGVYGAIYFSHYAAAYLSGAFNWGEQTTNLAAFAVTFIVIVFVISMAGKLLTKIADFAALGIINKLAGGVFNAIKYAFIISVIFMYINASTSISGFMVSEEKKADSVLYEPVASIAPIFLPNIFATFENYRKGDGETQPEEAPDKEK
jgi:membrane protein required for colicin V production